MRRDPLAGRRIAITRPQHGADDLAGRLEVLGAVALRTPLIRIEPTGTAALHAAVERLATYDWAVFTSAMGVARMAAAVAEVGSAPAPRVAAVGPATAAAVTAQLGWEVTLVPASFTGSSLAAALCRGRSLEGARVLWPRAAEAREAVAEALAAAGAHLDDPVVYRTVADEAMAAALVARIDAGEVDAVTFTSPSAVAAYTAVRAPERRVVIVAIGPVTAEACRARGIAVDVMPAEHTVAALVEALAAELGT